MKSILITGCSSGIGYDAAVALRERGWKVFASCRQQKDCDRLAAMGFDSPLLDYTDETTIKATVDHVLKETGGTLDAVYNNGAYATPGLVEDLPTDALRANFETNFFGYHTLNRLVIPVMRTQGHGRILNCSSVLGFAALKWRGSYNSTKYALEGLTDTMRMELKPANIHVVSIEPGPITTDIRVNSQGPFEKWIDWEKSARRDSYRHLKERLYATDTGKDMFELPPSAVTKKIIHALESKNPKPYYLITTATYIMATLRRILPSRAFQWFSARL